MGKIHFIWAGGERPIPELSALTIRAWQALNPDAQVCIWVDDATLSRVAADSLALPAPSEAEALTQLDRLRAIHKLRAAGSPAEKETQTLVAELHPYGFRSTSIVIESVRSLERSIADYVTDPEFAGQMQSLYDIAIHECSRIRPNFGASSDIFRYLILFFHSGPADEWGAYFDHDVLPGSFAIERTFTDSESKIFFAANSQGWGLAGNDAFISRERHSPLIKIFLQKVYRNYFESHRELATRMPLYEVNSLDIRRYDTVMRTGPLVIASSLYDLYRRRRLNAAWRDEHFKLSADVCSGIVPPRSRAIPLTVCPGSPNANSWLNPPIQPGLSLRDVLAQAKRTIALEARLGFMHLDDHVADCVASLAAGRSSSGFDRSLGLAESAAGGAGGAGAEFDESMLVSTDRSHPTSLEQRIAVELVASLDGLDLTHLQARPLISRYAVIRDYYARFAATCFDYSDGSVSAGTRFSELLSEPPATRFAVAELQAIADHWIPNVAPFFRKSLAEIRSKHAAAEETLNQADFLQRYLLQIVDLKRAEAAYGISLPIEERELLAFLAECVSQLPDSLINRGTTALLRSTAGRSAGAGIPSDSAVAIDLSTPAAIAAAPAPPSASALTPAVMPSLGSALARKSEEREEGEGDGEGEGAPKFGVGGFLV